MTLEQGRPGQQCACGGEFVEIDGLIPDFFSDEDTASEVICDLCGTTNEDPLV